MKKYCAPGEDRTHDLQIALCICDYETDALPTALPRHLFHSGSQLPHIGKSKYSSQIQ